MAVARDFATSGEIFLTYAEPSGRGAATALARAQLEPDAARLTGLRVIFRQGAPTTSGRHFGSRVVEAPDGTLYLTLGERGERDSAQDPSSFRGKVVRLNRDGSAASGNPFAGGTGDGAPEVWSYGHRNPQGAALAPDGALLTVEHGARGGDEVNRPAAGGNYGWPEISFGREYSGGRIGEGTSAPGMEPAKERKSAMAPALPPAETLIATAEPAMPAATERKTMPGAPTNTPAVYMPLRKPMWRETAVAVAPGFRTASHPCHWGKSAP